MRAKDAVAQAYEMVFFGEIGRAVHGLRTTLLTFVLMALLRIERPEHFKEETPSRSADALGSIERRK